ncbi:MAG: transglutaminase domain-containing protein, partial [Saprospiraceae bacterium]|nr:transglutaminase domain-containing protein [Saprospiraceae bacterium]
MGRVTQQLITTALLIAGCAYLPAAQESTSTLTKEDVPAEVRALTLEIVTGISEDSLQIIALYDWLTSNIRYDGAGTGGQRINRSAADVLRRRKAICFGYAQLLQQMCTVLDIPAHVISGYSNQSGRGNASQAPDHAWNAVCFNDQWRLIDATWGAAQTGKRQNSQQAWLFVAPEEFLSSHLPAQPVWQLLDCPVDRQWQPSLPCGYHDTLQQFLALPPAQRKLEEARMAFGFHPTEANRTEFL